MTIYLSNPDGFAWRELAAAGFFSKGFVVRLGRYSVVRLSWRFWWIIFNKKVVMPSPCGDFYCFLKLATTFLLI